MKNKIINAGLGYTIGNILIKGISFLTIPIYTRIMSTEHYGMYNHFFSFVSIITFLVSMGLDPTLKNAEYEFKEEKDTYLSTVYIMVLLFTSLLIVLSFLFRDILVEYIGLNYFLVVLILLQSCATSIINIYNVKLSLSYSSKKYLLIAFFNTIASITLSLLFIFLMFREKTYIGRIIGSIIPLLVVGAIIIYKKVFKLNKKKIDKKMIIFGLTLGIPLIPHLLSQIMNSQFDRIMISNMIGFSEAGIYSFTYNIAIILQIVYQSLDNVWSPWLFSKLDKKEYSLIIDASKKYVALITFFTVSLLTICKEFIMIFSSSEYWSGAGLAPILLFGIYFLYLYTLPVGVEYFYKKTKYISICSVITCVINIVLNYFCILKFGYIAAAYTTLISYIILFVLHWNVYRKILDEKIYDLKNIGINILVVLIATMSSLLLQNNFILKYILYILFLIWNIFYFFDDIKLYLKNMKAGE